MDLNQRKLNKSEWDSIEIPVNEYELKVLKMLINGFHDVRIRTNTSPSLFTYLKLDNYSSKMEDYIYDNYLRQRTEKIEQKIVLYLNTLSTTENIYKYKPIKVENSIKLNSADRIRVERFDGKILSSIEYYEDILLTVIEKLLNTNMSGKNLTQFHFHYYCIYKLCKNNILLLNRHIHYLSNEIIKIFENYIQKSIIIENAVEFIEKNPKLLKYDDLILYSHQKEIFTAIKTPTPKLILYIAPTGTGKTLTPIALSEQKKIIFVCAVRHVGLALAKAAISAGKKIAFAFGCSSAADIRLHYFAAKEYTRNRRSGGIGKVDNSVGDNVQIIICDIRSYLPAMYYMLAFFEQSDIVTYWDEPTITMDYDTHDFHKIIRKNWKKNCISTVVLSSATLPKQSELTETIPDFITKFPGAEIINITSHDCKKSIPIVNKDGYVVLPHYLSDNYLNIKNIANHCTEYLTLLRYLDLKEVVNFITYINKNNYASNKMILDRHFEDIDSITMTSIKKYYIEMLKNIKPENWKTIYDHFQHIRCPRILENNSVDVKGNKIKKVYSFGPETSSSLGGAPIVRLASEQMSSSISHNKTLVKGTSGVYVTTKDSHTLTDGPTIFISTDIEKIARFCVQQANIPDIVMSELMKKIEYNNTINSQMQEIETELDLIAEAAEEKAKNEVKTFYNGVQITGRNKSNKDNKKLSKYTPDDNIKKSSITALTVKLNTLRSLIKKTSLNDTFVPNKKHHLEKWAPNEDTSSSFTSSIDEYTVLEIMSLNGVDNLWKILLMMGIGVFINHPNIKYTEIMKQLADEQKIYLIIATSDYIYGTNYQFCHGFLSKDLDLTQEKIIQAMGRIGRNNIQQTYTVRFRDDTQIEKIFTSDTAKPEVINMNKLFNSTKVDYIDGKYIEVPDDIDDDIINDTSDDNDDTDTDTDTDKDNVDNCEYEK